MRWARGPLRSSFAALAICGVLAAGALAASTAFPPQLPAKAQRIIEHDWCSASSYTAAKGVPGVSKPARQNLAAAERVALAHPRGCRRAERSARARAEHRFPRGNCPRDTLPLRSGARQAAAAAAARFEGRAIRPVIVGYFFRLAQVRGACGRSIARRTVVVNMSLTAMLPSASLSERDVAVSHIRGDGWRVWMVLH
jgi:hypothetical protein